MGNGVVLFSVTLAVLFAFVTIDNAEGAAFVKYDGVDGESKDSSHQNWSDLLSYDWAAKQPGAGTGQSRRRGAVIVDDVTITMEYDKASPLIMKSMMNGEVIPKLEIEQTASFGGSLQTYLRWELCNVLITDYSVSADDPAIAPTVVVGNNFEEIKVTYTELGSSQAPIEVGYNVKTGSVGRVSCEEPSGAQ